MCLLVFRVSCGVPQGSTLEPLLFLLYVNDISRILLSENVKLFADDSSLFIWGVDVILLLCLISYNGTSEVCRLTERIWTVLSHLHPSIVCLQETFLKKNKIFTFKGFSCCHNYATEVNGVAHGGSSILIKSSTPHAQIGLHINLQAVAIHVTCHKTITVCSIYLPASIPYQVQT